MNTIEQAQEVAKQLRSLMGSWPLPQEAADTIDALIAELNDERMRCAQADNAVAQMAAELATLKGQEPVFYINQDSLSAFKDGAKGWGTVWTVNHGDYKVPLYPAPGAQPYDQQAMELCEACGWKAIIPGEQCLVCERNDALAAGAQLVPEGYALISIAMLRTWGVFEDVIEQCQYPAAREQAGAQVKTETCPVCGEDAPFTGSCGGGRDNPKALCYEAAPVQQQQFGNEAHFTTRQERNPLGQDWIEERAHRRCSRYIGIDTEAPYQFNAHTLMDLVRDIEAKIKEQP